ncbi:MAG TPA: VTT domain-containing protein [Candidatus Paceibacterota bacterium]|nr:VTT domain-containing protein [Candidatus Paceibacterota bacterium]
MSPYADILSLIQGAAATPWLAPLAIILSTFILEDAAMVGTGVLAADGVVSVPVGLAALWIGIALGDFWLYGMGRLAITHPRIRRWVEHERVQPLRGWLDDKLFSVVTATRFLPGMRLPTYLACGFFALPFKRFATAVVVGTLIWVPLLFGAAYLFGYYTLDWLGIWRWPIALAAVAVLIFAGRRHWKQVMEESGTIEQPHA